MKTLEFDLGGRPLANDDLVTLQDETTASVAALYTGRGAFIVAGCQVSGNGPAYNVSAGILFLDGQLLRFYGAGGVTLPMQFQRGGFDLLDQRTYQVGGTKTCIRERVAVLVTADPTYTGGEFIPFDTWGGKRWDDVMRASVRYVGETLPLSTAAYVPTDYDATGLGKPGSPAWGWALCNGQNGTDDLRALTIAGMSDFASPYFAGVKGGVFSVTLTTANLPANPAGTPDVATFTGNANAKNLVQSGNNGWEGRQPLAGIGQALDARSPYIALPIRQWVGYGT